MKSRITFFSITGVLLFLTGIFLCFREGDKAIQVQTLPKIEVARKANKLAIPFIANDGQMDEQVGFYANMFRGCVFVTKSGEIVYSLPKVEEKAGLSSNCQEETDSSLHRKSLPAPYVLRNDGQRMLVIKEKILDGNIDMVKGEKKSETSVNYFRGSEPSKWKSNISAYETVNVGEVYKGIEVKLNAYGDNVEKLFCVKPGAAPEDITIQIEGADTLKVNEEGLLVAETVLGDIQFTKPVAYQDIDGGKILVAAKYRLIEKSAATHEAGPVYGFEIGEYDKTRELVIDPLLSSTYLGGAKGDYGASMVLDAEGNVYVTGWTKSSDFPKTTGIYDKSYGGGDGDAFVSKLSGDLTSLLASTFLGGTFLDSGNAITLDSEGNVYVTGTTYSKDFPTTTDAYNNAYNNKGDAFVAKLNGSLTSLLAATYLGDEENDEGNSITISSDGSVYVTGVTFSSDFPASADAYDNFYDGDGDAFVSKMNGDLTNLLASTFFGGGLADFGSSVFIGQDGSVYVGGKTSSSTFPVTDAYDSTYNGGDADAFISKMDEDLSTLVAFTYIGGSSTDYGNKATIDSDGNIYIAGWTVSSNFPTTAGAYGGSFGGGEGDAFVSKLDGDLKSLLASTYLGGSADDNCYSVAVDSSGNIYAAGLTVSSDFPTTTGAYNTSFGGGDGDVFVSKLDENLGSLSASTYLGGTALDYGNSVAVSSDGSVYVTGFAGSSDFPTARGSYDTSSNGSDDIFISKLDSGLSVDVEAEGTSLVGYVVDKKSKPVTSAKVTLKGTLDPTKEETTTDSAGFFEFADLEADTYKIEISKKGYKKYKESIDLEEGTTEELEITLKKAK